MRTGYCLLVLLLVATTGAQAARHMTRTKGPVDDFKRWCDAIPNKFKEATDAVDTAISNMGNRIDEVGRDISSDVTGAFNAVKKGATDAAAPITAILSNLDTWLAKMGEFLLNLVPGPLKEIVKAVYDYVSREASPGGFDNVELKWGSLSFIKQLHDKRPFGIPDYVWKRVAFFLNAIPTIAGRHHTLLSAQASQVALLEEMEEVLDPNTPTTTSTTPAPTTPTTAAPLYNCVFEGDAEDKSVVWKGSLNDYQYKKSSCAVMLATARILDGINQIFLGFTSAWDSGSTPQLVIWGITTVFTIFSSSLQTTCTLAGF